MKLICPDCGKQYDSGKFCPECGGKLQEIVPELVCPSCGYKAKTGKFCPECGTKLTEQVAVSGETLQPSAESKFNEKAPEFAKYYDKKGFPRTIPLEEYAVAVEELTPFVEQDVAEAKMLLGNIMCNNQELQGMRLIKEAEEDGNKLAYYLMGICYFYGFDTIEQDHSEAEKRMLEAYDEYKDAETAGLLAELYTFSAEKCDYAKAFEYATFAAEDDDKTGYNVLGTLYLNGWGVEENIELALENYKIAAAFGEEVAMSQIGFIYMGSENFEADPKQAFFWFNEAAQKGSDVGMNNLGYCYANGIGVERDMEKAAEWYKKAAEAGYVDAMYELGAYYQDVLVDNEKAKTWYLKAAEMGYSEGQNKLAVLCHALGEYKEAIKWYKKAMEQDEPWAYRNYAWCLWNGEGIKANKKKAMDLMLQAIELGCPNAEKELQDMQSGNIDEEIDKANEDLNNGKYKEAVAVYKKYANEGNVRAMTNLGLRLLEGTGIKRNMQLGTEWLTKAAEAGFPFACCRLVEVYTGTDYKGKTMKANLKLAKKYLKLAKEYGANDDQIKPLEDLLTPSVEFKEIHIEPNVTFNGQLGFQVTGNLLIKGLLDEKMEFSAYCVDEHGDKHCLNKPGKCIELIYNESFSPTFMSAIWDNYGFFIPYKAILNYQTDLDECLYMVVWHKEGRKNTKLLQIKQPYHISCKTHVFRSNEYFFYLK
ncbi:MAG: zinc ribbon domain-containing protein [Bacteroidaceae bacterium]|nr:zinc ribbon domain-containing protein [Bacteroidaceae bacterium]